MEMTENEAIKLIENDLKLHSKDLSSKYKNGLRMAINALEKQEKIKEAFEMWKAETGGYYGADDETTRFISTLNQILRSDEE